MQRVELEVSLREATGKGAARRLRAGGIVPAVVYGSGSETVKVQVDAHTLTRLVREGTNQLIDLTGDGLGKGRLVLIKELQRDPVSRQYVHADFFQVDTSKKIHVQVPVRYVGKPHGVEMGGVLEVVIREVAVQCLPLEIPDGFEIDVSELDIGDARHASDLEVPDAVELQVDAQVVIVHVITPRVVEEPTEGEEGDEAVDVVEGAEGEATEGDGETKDESAS